MLTIWYYMIWYDVALPAIPKDERISVSHYSGEFRRYTPCSGNKNIIYMYLFTHKIIHIYIWSYVYTCIILYTITKSWQGGTPSPPWDLRFQLTSKEPKYTLQNKSK